MANRVRSFLERHAPTTLRAARTIGGRRFELFPPRTIYALGELHRNILKHFGRRGGTFFEVGANDGIEQSNTAYLERYLGWRGILVEAVPHKFVQCVANRPEAKVFHAGLVPFDHGRDHVEIAYSNLMSVSDVSVVDGRAHAEQGAKWLGGERGLLAQTFLAPARTTDAILRAAGDPTIDLFSLDVEGAEMAVLGGVDFARNRPVHFLIEAYEPEAMHAAMRERGYRLIDRLSFHDYLYRDERE